MQLRVEGGEAQMLTRKGLDWTDKFAAIGQAARDLPDCIIDGEMVALDHNGVPVFATLQAALSEGRSEDLIYFVFDLRPFLACSRRANRGRTTVMRKHLSGWQYESSLDANEL